MPRLTVLAGRPVLLEDASGEYPQPPKITREAQRLHAEWQAFDQAQALKHKLMRRPRWWKNYQRPAWLVPACIVAAFAAGRWLA